MAKIVILSGPCKGAEHTLGKEATLGRDSRCDVPLKDSGVSRQHARIRLATEGFRIEDLGSRNGTFVNQQQAQDTLLRHGDRIEIPPFLLAFNDPGEGDPSVSLDVSLTAEDSMTRSAVVDAAEPDKHLVEEAPEDSSRTRAIRRRLKAFVELSNNLAGALDTEALLAKILDFLFEVYPQAERGFVMLYSADGSTLEPRAVKRRQEGDTEEISVSRSVINEAVRNRRAVLCRDAAQDERFSAAVSLAQFGIRSMMCAPLLGQAMVRGVVHVDTTSMRAPFTQEDLDLLVGVSSQAAVALENTALHEENVTNQRLAAIGQTVAGLAHCIKNILNGIQGGSYILDKGLEQAKPVMVAKGWDMVKRNNVFMADLVMDMLTFAKDRVPEVEFADVNQLCGDICELMRAKAKQKGVEIECVPDLALRQATLDPKGIRRSLLNLVSNAVDACDDGGRVRVILDAVGAERFTIRVADSGCGIPEEHRKKLFQVFFSSKGSKGTGLGLAVTGKIIQEHGGRIDVETEVGQGTTFIITLPREARIAAQRQAE